MATEAGYTTSASNLNEVDSDAEGTGHYGDPFEVKSLTDDDADLRVGENTPDTVLPDVAPYPDISMFCERCSTYVPVSSVMDHRAYHAALAALRYGGDSHPEDVAGLTERRHAMIKALTSASSPELPVDPKDVQKINDAYEFLKSDYNDTYDQYRQMKEPIEVSHITGMGLNCSTSCALAVGLCSAPNERWKAQMEDTRVFQDYFGNSSHKCFFAVYDGHNGCCTAEVTANELHHAMLCEMSKFDPTTKCTCTFNMANSYDISRYNIHGNDERHSSKTPEGTLMHAYSINAIQQIIHTCHRNVDILDGKLDDKTMADEEDMSPKRNKTKHQNPFDEKMANAFIKAHRYCDVIVSQGKDEYSRVRWSGCSTVCCVLQDSEVSSSGVDTVTIVVDGNGNAAQNCDTTNSKMAHEMKQLGEKTVPLIDSNGSLIEHGVIHLANAGNIRAVLLRGNKAYCLSRDHTASNPKERARVLKEGGTISESERELEVNGVLAATRGLGNHGDPALKSVVIPDPYTTSVKIDQYSQMLVLASYGVWEVFSPTEVASILLQMLPSNRLPTPSDITSSVGVLLRSGSSSPSSTSVSSTITGMSTGEIPRAPSRMDRRGSDNSGKIGAGLGKTSENLSTRSGSRNGERSRDKSDANTKDGYSRGSTACDDAADLDASNELLNLCAPPGAYPLNRAEYLRDFAKILSERLVQAALMAGSRENVSALIILLPGCGL